MTRESVIAVNAGSNLENLKAIHNKYFAAAVNDAL